MSITATELKINLGKYLMLAETEDIYITRNGKVVAKLSNPYQDRVDVAKSLFGILPADMTLDEDAVHAKKEALNGRFVMSWDELTKHLMECARNTLNGEESGLGDTVLQMAEEAFAKTVRD